MDSRDSVLLPIQISEEPNNNTPKYSGDIFSYNEVFTIVQSEHRPETLLNGPRDVIRASNGHYYVNDAGNNRIAIYDDGGYYISEINRVGDGPGEYRNIHQVAEVNNTIMLVDGNTRKLLFYDYSGIYLNTIRYNNAVRDVYYTNDEMIVAIKRYAMTRGVMRYEQKELNVMRVTGDTIATIIAKPTAYEFIPINTQGFYMQPYGERSSFYVHPSKGILFSNGIEPYLEWYDYYGDNTVKIYIELDRIQVGKNDIIVFEKYLDEYIMRNPSGLSARVKRSYKMPKYRPYWDEIIVDDRDYYWLHVPDIPHHRNIINEPKKYIVLSPEGEYLGCTIPPISREWTINDGYYSTIYSDTDSGLINVKIYAINSNCDSLIYPN
ncbi:6-bladed beta-propeller [Gemmatimonadota bacterium]